MPQIQNMLAAAGFHFDIVGSILLFFLIFARFVSALALTPFLGGNAVASQIKVGLAVILAAVLFPALSHSSGFPPSSPVLYLLLLLKESFIGLIFGFTTQLIFYGVEIAGTVIDTQRGLNQITYLAPQLPGNVSALGNLQFQTSVVLFLGIGGHLYFLERLAHSFSVIPLLRVPHLAASWFPLAEQAVKISSSALLIGAQLCAPVVLTIFLVDAAFGSIGRMASSVQISNDSNTAKSWIGLAVFVLSLPFFLDKLQRFLISMIPMLDKFVRIIQLAG